MSLEAKKIDLVQLILAIDDESLVDAVRAKVEPFFSRLADQEAGPPLERYFADLEDRVDLAKIKAEQGFTGIDPTKMDALIRQADIQEPLDELLAMID